MQGIRQKLLKNNRGVSEENLIQAKTLELYKSVYLSYKTGNSYRKRELLQEIASNRLISGKNITIKLRSPYQELCALNIEQKSAPSRGWSRTFIPDKTTFKEKLLKWIKGGPGEAQQSP